MTNGKRNEEEPNEKRNWMYIIGVYMHNTLLWQESEYYSYIVRRAYIYIYISIYAMYNYMCV